MTENELRNQISRFSEFTIVYVGPITSNKEIEAIVRDKFGDYRWPWIARQRGLTIETQQAHQKQATLF